MRKTLTAIGFVVIAGACGQGEAERPESLRLIAHDSFAGSVNEETFAAFTGDTGIEVEMIAAGDAGSMVNQAALSAGNPLADVMFGVDDTFLSRALDEDIFVEYQSELLDDVVTDLRPETRLVTPIDFGDVCLNYDKAWFESGDLPVPETLDDLTDPAYAGLMVTPGASTSSPGMAFFLATVAAYGDDWQDYWTDLLANGAKVVDGWEDAYYGDFTQGGGGGERPIVLSYDSSPAFTVDEKTGESTTAALLDTCFRQVEYAGVLTGADNPEGAAALVDWMLTDEVQSALPESMYVFPVMPDATVPDDWAEFAPQPAE